MPAVKLLLSVHTYSFILVFLYTHSSSYSPIIALWSCLCVAYKACGGLTKISMTIYKCTAYSINDRSLSLVCSVMQGSCSQHDRYTVRVSLLVCDSRSSRMLCLSCNSSQWAWKISSAYLAVRQEVERTNAKCYISATCMVTVLFS